MYINLYDRGDRLGSNILKYISQILFAHNNNYIIKFTKNKSEYRFYHSIFIKAFFQYIEKYNEELIKNNFTDDYEIDNKYDCLVVSTSESLKNIKLDFVSYFYNNIYNSSIIDFTDLSSKYVIPFDVNKTILVHLRLDDIAYRYDYDGSICSEYYKKKIENNEICDGTIFDILQNNTINMCAPLSKTKLENIINKAKEEFVDYKVILLTSPCSDTSFLNYEVIKNHDESLDLYLLTMCNVTILSRSTFALSSLFFNKNKVKTYIPLWGHFITCGLDTIYDKNDKSKFHYFY
jgi:hypothetical protein